MKEEMRLCRSSSEMTWGVDTSDTSNKHASRRGEGVVPYGPVKALPIAKPGQPVSRRGCQAAARESRITRASRLLELSLSALDS